MELTDTQRTAIDQYAANAWFVYELIRDYQSDPSSVPESWRKIFFKLSIPTRGTLIAENTDSRVTQAPVQISGDDETFLLQGGVAKIAENMTASLSVPTATSLRTVPVRLLEENRRIINQALFTRNMKISFTHLIAYAVLRAIKTQPSMNYAYATVNGQPHLLLRKKVNLGIAVDVEKKDGNRSLMVPNIKDCGDMDFRTFVDAYDGIVRKTRSGKIDPSDFQGTTISLTNPGTIGTVSSTPRLMAGQGTIIATGAIEFPAEFAGMPDERIADLGISKIMTITSTYDHRIIQGADSGLFLKTICEYLNGHHHFYDDVFSHFGLAVRPLKFEKDNITASAPGTGIHPEKQQKVFELINMYRVRGHLAAKLDPLMMNASSHSELDPSFYGFTIWDYDRTFLTGGLGNRERATLREILDTLNQTYCGHIGAEFRHIQSPDERQWLQNHMESVRNRPVFDDEVRKRILRQLIIAETFEHFIHTKFIGHKRFSLEGGETLIPVLDHLLSESAERDILEVVIGMSHRGRLNVLGNIVGKWYTKIFAEFEGDIDSDSFQGSGDVKYHLGAAGMFHTRNNRDIKITLAPNPSHLEWVNPVVEGIVRAKQSRKSVPLNKSYLAVQIHGDAAFAGQGVVAETLNFSQLKGYRTRGTIHIVVNNQIGFTTMPEEARSSTYATDVAKMIHAPVFHVNADDPEAALCVTQLALDYRMKFEKDVVIDLVCYRRHGHNEGDEPGYTQPLMVHAIRNHPSTKELYTKKLIDEKLTTQDQAAEFEKNTVACLDESLTEAKSGTLKYEPDAPLAVPIGEQPLTGQECSSCIDDDELRRITDQVTAVPDLFQIHPKLRVFLDHRRKLLSEDIMFDWSFAETLAFGSLLLKGIPVRLSGEDSRRGTFSQRHSVLMDMKTGDEYCPLNHLSPDQARFDVYDSLLSEAGVLGFEFGFSIADPMTLVLWEAQFGDFANTAQPIIDNFIAACRSKWQLQSGLVLLLPHGQEGQGAEHSSARLERFLQLCAEDNLRVCNLTTPAQYFHALRQQMLRFPRIPLILMTPKSLLRNPSARSSKNEFTGQGFRDVIDDPSVNDHGVIDRIIFCSGKVYYDLVLQREKTGKKNIALIRVEQLYPYPEKAIQNVLSEYPVKADVVWAQEEPQNMGAWSYIALRLQNQLSRGQQLIYAGRSASASPAAGTLKMYKKEFDRFMHDALL